MASLKSSELLLHDKLLHKSFSGHLSRLFDLQHFAAELLLCEAVV